MFDRGKYEKISDMVYVIANRVVLKMNVSLSYYTNDNKRINYHREVEYPSQKINSNLINIKRQFDYYLSIEHTVDKSYIRIGITEMMKIQQALHEAYKFFSDKIYANLYAKKDGELILYMNPNPIVITDLPQGKYLQFEPCVYIDFRGESQRGLRMYLSSKDSYCDISINRLEGLIYIMDNFNLFQSGQIMLNYFGRPDFGTNLWSFDKEPDTEEDANFSGKDGREVTIKKNESYFDRMKKLE